MILPTYSDIHQNDVGTEFLATIMKNVNGIESPMDISKAVSKQIVIRKPDNTVLVRHAIFTPISSGALGTGVDGKLSYFSVPGDLDIRGTYRIQAVVTNPQGKWFSSIDKFKVVGNL